MNLVILGAGESGTGAALLGKAKGWEVFVSDQNRIPENYKAELEKADIPFEEGGHSEEKILAAEEIIKSPGIPDQALVVRKALDNKIPVIAELEFAYRYIDANIVLITGTNGKTTTTLLTHHLFRESGLNATLAGNVGNSLAREAIEDKYDYYIVEVSSFQLEGMSKFKANAATLLNITPDHLDRYDYDIEKYIAAKFRVVNNMRSGDAFIYLKEDPIIAEALEKRKLSAEMRAVSLAGPTDAAAWFQNDRLHFTQPHPWAVETTALPVRGRHNYVNAMAAVLAGLHFGITPDSLKKGLQTFKNAPHRMEPAGEVNGVKYINDSKATNVDAVYYALESFRDPVIWIAGGVDKGNDYKTLKPLVEEKVKAIVCLGKDNAKIKEAFKAVVPDIAETDNAYEAVELAYHFSRPGYTVLLSPACASFDLFKNYVDRGEQFKQATRAFKRKLENQEEKR